MRLGVREAIYTEEAHFRQDPKAKRMAQWIKNLPYKDWGVDPQNPCKSQLGVLAQ